MLDYIKALYIPLEEK